MNQKKMKELIIDYIDGNLTGELKEFVAKHITKDPESRKYYEQMKATMELLKSDKALEPDSSLRYEFEAALQQEIKAANDDRVRPLAGRQWSFAPWQVAASVALVVSGVFIGMWLVKDQNNDRQLAELRKEMETTKSLVLQSLNDETSASRRLQGINASYEVRSMDGEMINALIRTMNNDENTNVRLAAVEALSHFTKNNKVMNALIASMESQTDPLVQITLINLMVQLKEKGALQELQKIIKDEKTMQTVKDEAHMAVFKLS